MNIKTSIKPYLMLLPALLLSACDNNGSNDNNFKDAAVIATRAPDYSSGALSLVETTAPFTASNNLAAGDSSDVFVRSGGDHYFLIKRFGTDQVLRFEANNPTTPTYTYSTQDADDGSTSSNPSELIIVSDTKAYLLRYGSDKLWIVNPSAATEAAFKIGEIDLSAYDSDGVPEMTAGVVKNGKLYVLMQRLEAFSAVKDGYVAVIDTATNTEIDTQPTVDGLKGIEVPVRNPGSVLTIPGSDKLLVVSGGGYGGAPDYALLYNGGIVSINPSGYTATLLLDDGDTTTHPYGQFIDVAVASGDRAYLVGSTGFFGPVQTLYRFNPAGGGVPTAVPNFSNKELGSLAIDPTGKLWIGRAGSTAPGVTILGFEAGTETVVKDLIDTNLTPINIDFVTVPVI